MDIIQTFSDSSIQFKSIYLIVSSYNIMGPSSNI
jgi:hypothetical protein